MKLLITGSNGLLGQKIVKYCQKNNISFLATSKGQNRNQDCPEEHYASLDITMVNQINQVFHAYEPTHIIHTAAITNVDQCETNPELCRKVNVEATQSLIKAAENFSAHFQLLSTDFVFDGAKGSYAETDEINPLSEYARSKADAEQFVQEYTNDWSIVRTIIVYGVGNNLSRSNLIVWAKGALDKGESINIIDDQYRAPTYADDLAEGCLEILIRSKTGIYHLCGPETMSIFKIVERIAKHFNLSMENVHKISTAELNQPAARPPKTGFDLTKATNDLNYSPRTLENTLDLIFK